MNVRSTQPQQKHLSGPPAAARRTGWTPLWALVVALAAWQCAGGSAARSDTADPDGDGVLGSRDLCPHEPEDLDGFQDQDGCPDFDNDGDGIADAHDQCPDSQEDHDGWLDEDGCPDHDNDQDGLADARDQCPNEAEDWDGWQDHDGCPDEDDTDGDGLVDSADACPQQPENYNGLLDHDGCPDEIEVVVRETCEEIRLWQQVYFAPGSAELDEAARLELDQVAHELLTNPVIESVLVQGHTDSRERGSTDGSVQLSQARADAIREYLVRQGVPSELLAAQGYGDERPVARNSETEGRAHNRRVTFEVIEPVGCT
jgi:outer membrane protein OmpA-like peptidoglycan-associated protein